MFMRKVFVSHYCNIPYHLLDKDAKRVVEEKGLYPSTLIEEIYAGAFHLIRNFELAPFANDTGLEDLIADKVEKGEI